MAIQASDSDCSPFYNGGQGDCLGCMYEGALPIMDMVQSLAVAVGIPAGDVNMRVSVHEDNLGALVLAETLPPQFMPRSKYYATKTIWFHEEINKRGIKLLKIETSEQLEDMFTKGLAKPTFEYLRSKNHWLVSTFLLFPSCICSEFRIQF